MGCEPLGFCTTCNQHHILRKLVVSTVNRCILLLSIILSSVSAIEIIQFIRLILVHRVHMILSGWFEFIEFIHFFWVQKLWEFIEFIWFILDNRHAQNNLFDFILSKWVVINLFWVFIFCQFKFRFRCSKTDGRNVNSTT